MPTVFVTVFKFFNFSFTDQLSVAPIWLSISNRSSHFLLLKENENKTKLAFVAWISQFNRHPRNWNLGLAFGLVAIFSGNFFCQIYMFYYWKTEQVRRLPGNHPDENNLCQILIASISVSLLNSTVVMMYKIRSFFEKSGVDNQLELKIEEKWLWGTQIIGHPFRFYWYYYHKIYLK